MEGGNLFAPGEGSTARIAGHVERVLGVGGWEIDPDREVLHLSPGARELLDVSEDAIELEALNSHFLAPGGDDLIEALSALRAEGQRFQMELALHCRGTSRLLQVIGECQRTGSRLVCMGTLQDVTERSAVAQRLRMSERMLAKANEMAQIGVWVVDLRTGELSWSDEVFRIHDLPVGQPPSVEDAIGFYDAEVQAELRGALEVLQRTGEPFDLELPLITAKQRHIWVRAIGDLDREGGVPVKLYGVFQDITAMRTAGDALRERERRWWLALAGAEDGVWDWDLRTNEVYLSARWKQLIGYSDHEIPNRFDEWNTRLHPEDRERVGAAIDAHLAGETESYVCEHRLAHRDGTWRHHLGKGKVVAWDEQGHPTRFVGTESDISDQVRMRDELVRAKDAAEAAVQAKSDFLAVMSHEIRTPLNAVLGLAQILRDAELSDELGEYVEAIHSSGDLLLSVLNDVLDFAKIEAGKLAVEREPFRLRDMVRKVIDLQRGVAEQKAIEIVIDVWHDVPDQLIGDAGRIKQVLHNLIGNALKFTDEGAVTVSVHSFDETGRLWFGIADTGPGIPRERREHIFEAFSQADTSTTRKHGGTGLGLAICKQLVELMGGEIGFESASERGTVFWFELEFDVFQEQDEVDLDPEDVLIEPGMRVLVVEDNPVNLLVARKMFGKLGCSVDVAGNGLEAIEMVARFAYDVVFMDCHMPEMDGFDATRIILEAQSGCTRPVPIVAMTANVLPEHRQRCRDAGMVDFVSKPFALRDIVAVLGRIGVTGPAVSAG